MENKKKAQTTIHKVSATTKKDIKYSLTIIGEENERIDLTQDDFDMIISCGKSYEIKKLSNKKNKKKKKNKTIPFATLTIVKGKKYYYKNKELTPKKAEKKFEKGLTAVIDKALKSYEENTF